MLSVKIRSLLLSVLGAACVAQPAAAQPHVPARVDIAWNRYYDFEAIEGHMRALADAYPELIELRSIGKSRGGRDMWLAIVTSPDVRKGTGDHAAKPAMWIDGNIHANEIQAAEVVLYSIWYLAKSYGENPALTELLDRTTFYMLPVVSPDSRAAWFSDPATPHFPRAGIFVRSIRTATGSTTRTRATTWTATARSRRCGSATPTAATSATSATRAFSSASAPMSAASGAESAGRASTTTATGCSMRTGPAATT
jgi:hypothetical protein